MGAALAYDVTGNWVGRIDSECGASETHAIFRQDGNVINGRLEFTGAEVRIRNGALRKNRLQMELWMPDGSIQDFDLILKGDRLEGNVRGRGESGTRARVVLRREVLV